MRRHRSSGSNSEIRRESRVRCGDMECHSLRYAAELAAPLTDGLVGNGDAPLR